MTTHEHSAPESPPARVALVDDQAATPEARALLPVAAVAVTLVLWASAFVAIRHLGASLGAGELSLARLVVGSLALGAVAAVRRERLPPRSTWLPVAAVGLLWFGVYNVALNAGEQKVDAGTAAMLIQVSPVLVAVLAAVVLRERSSRWLVVGLAVALTGVVLIGVSADRAGGRDPVGVLLVLLAAVVYAVALVVQKPVMARATPLQVVWCACTVGAVACLPFVGGLTHDLSTTSRPDLLWVVYLGLFPTAIAFTTYAYALRHMSAASLSITTYLVPPLAVLMSWAFLGETPTLAAVAGGALCLLGVALSRRR